MCDPVTILTVVSSLAGVAGAASSDVPEVPKPLAVAPEALEDTGADVILGGTEDEDDADLPSVASQATTSTAGLATFGNGTGISIL